MTLDNIIEINTNPDLYYNLRSLAWKFKQEDKNKYAITGYIQGRGNQRLIGRIIQVRLGQGAYGTDLVLFREPSGELSQHSNQSFTIIEDNKSIEYLNNLFKDVDNRMEDDADEYVYSADGVEHKGFIVDYVE